MARWLPPLLWAAVLLLASTDAFSSRETGGALHSLLDRLPPEVFKALHFCIRKGGHLLAYGLLGALTWRADRRVAVVLGFTAFIAVLDEWHQSMIPSRQGSGWDVLLDLAGAAVAVAVLRWWVGRRRR
ncbi:MAG TPA: VanZ family protein [Thermoanaerobaculia bacterium]|jgi:VanZ family protein